MSLFQTQALVPPHQHPLQIQYPKAQTYKIRPFDQKTTIQPPEKISMCHLIITLYSCGHQINRDYFKCKQACKTPKARPGLQSLCPPDARDPDETRTKNKKCSCCRGLKGEKQGSLKRIFGLWVYRKEKGVGEQGTMEYGVFLCFWSPLHIFFE